jgi:hypothetical protein
MCEEESDDAEAVSKLLEINDSIHRTIERYKLMKAGNIDAANKIAKGTLGTTTGVGKNAANEFSLIDFDPEPTAASEPSAANGSLLESALSSAPSGHTSVEDDLLGLSLDNGPPGMISLGPGTASGSGISSFATSSPPSFTAPGPGISRPPQQPSPKPNYDAFAALTSALPSSKPATPTPMQQQRQSAPGQTNIDPFAALVSASSRPSTPSQLRNMSQPKPPQDPFASLSQPNTSAPAPALASGASADDDWNFASALPEQPDTSVVQVHSGRIGIDFAAKRSAGQPLINVQARFSNQTQQPITQLHFQVAVEKSYSLQLRPQTGRELAPFQRNAVQQEILLSGVPPGKGSSVKIRFKVSYRVGDESVEEQGNVPALGIL